MDQTIGELRDKSLLESKRARMKGSSFQHYPKLGPKQRISPSDIDGFYEINGQVLILEEKRPGNPVTVGQHIALCAFSEKPGVEVVLFWGETDTDAPFATSLIRYENGEPKPPVACDFNDLCSLIRDWEMRANTHKRVFRGPAPSHKGD